MTFHLIGLLALGFTSAVLAYLLGIGGGALIVPMLVVFFNVPVHEAIAVSLVVIVASSLSITSVNLMRNLVNVRLALFLEFAAILGSVGGGFASVSIDEKVLSAVFAVVMLMTAFIMWRKSEVDTSKSEKPAFMGEFDREYQEHGRVDVRYYQVEKRYYTMLVAFFAGVTSGMLGLGGGVFKVPAMNIISKVPIKAAAATSNFMIFFTASAGAIPYMMKGLFHPAAAGMMVIGALAGSKFATGRLAKVESNNIKLIFILFLVFVAAQMVYKAVSV